MKAKIPPTSPKYKDKERNIEDFYSQNNLERIDKPSKKSKSVIYALLIALIFGILAGFFGGVLFNLLLLNYPNSFIPKKFNLHLPSSKETIISQTDTNQSKIDAQRQQIIQDLKPSIVNIFLTKSESKNALEQIYSESEILGSGIVLTSDGWIITTNSVINDLTKKYSIVQDNKKMYEAANLIKDPLTNLVFLKIDASGLKPVQFADKDSLGDGQEALVIRNIIPAGSVDLFVTNIVNLDYNHNSIQTGIIQSTERFSRFIKIKDNLDGIFKGALMANSKGEAIALSMINGENDKNLFIPFYYFDNKVISILLKEKEIQRPYLGVNYVDLSRVLNLPEALTQKMEKGALMYGSQENNLPAVISKSPAEKSGLEEGDIILSANGVELNNSNNFTDIIQDLTVGESVVLNILRNGKEQEIKVILGRVP